MRWHIPTKTKLEYPTPGKDLAIQVQDLLLKVSLQSPLSLQSEPKVLDHSGVFIRDFPAPHFNVNQHYTEMDATESNIEKRGGKGEFYFKT